MMHYYALGQTNGQQHGDQAAAAIADKGERQPRHRQNIQIHAHIDGNLKEENGRYTGGEQAAETVLRHIGNAQHAPDDKEEQRQN